MSPRSCASVATSNWRELMGKADLLRKKLDEAADANPRRFSTQDRKSWEAMKAGDLYVYYARSCRRKSPKSI